MLQRDIVCVPGHLGAHLGVARISWNTVPFIILVFYRRSHLGEFLRYHTPILGQLVHLYTGGSLWRDL
jgi:hypothetical protein